MASRNFHNRRTKERKARQRAENWAAEQHEFRSALRRFQSSPIVTLAAMGHAPKMFVRDGKSMPFENL